MARWLSINIITICILLVWSWYQGYDSNSILIGKLLAQAAFILFLINLNMYFVFLLIRKSKVRKVKITLAKISKRMMKYHVAIAVTGTLLVLIHAVIMTNAYLDDFWKLKTISGVIALMTLAVLLYSGLLRRWKSSGIRRRFHYTMAFIFFGCVFIHVFI